MCVTVEFLIVHPINSYLPYPPLRKKCWFVHVKIYYFILLPAEKQAQWDGASMMKWHSKVKKWKKKTCSFGSWCQLYSQGWKQKSLGFRKPPDPPSGAASGVARSQTTPGHCTRFFFFFWLGGYFPSKFLEVATQIVFETIFEMPSVLKRQTCEQWG